MREKGERRARVSLARFRAQIPFPFPFERLPRGLNPRPRADVSLIMP